jgi:hypothetical protein
MISRREFIGAVAAAAGLPKKATEIECPVHYGGRIVEWRNFTCTYSPPISKESALELWRRAYGKLKMQKPLSRSRELVFGFDGDGCWMASSDVHDDGLSFEWRIDIDQNGLFGFELSSSELTNRKDRFSTLAEAKAFCQEQEDELVASLEAENPPESSSQCSVIYQEGAES